jgi:hypothetical protein
MLGINQSALSIRLQRTDSQIYFFGDDESYLSATVNLNLSATMKVSSKGIKFAKSLQKKCKDCQRCCFNLIATVRREGHLFGKATMRHLVLISFVGAQEAKTA